MKKKIVALCLCICLAATAIAGASLAYFTDTDKADNTFTTGNIKIQLVEQQRTSAEDDTLIEFVQDKKVMPYTGEDGTKDLTKNYIDKIVNVYNKKGDDAYVRVLVAVPELLKNVLHIDWNTDAWTQTVAAEKVTINGTVHDVYVMTYNTALAKNTQTADQAMYGFYMDSNVDYGRNGYTLNGDVISYDLNRVTIPVFAQAIQAQGFESAEAAFAASGFTTDPWNVK